MVRSTSATSITSNPTPQTPHAWWEIRVIGRTLTQRRQESIAAGSGLDREGEAVADRDDDRFQRRLPRRQLVVGRDVARLLAGRASDLTHSQRVVGQQQSAAAHPLQAEPEEALDRLLVRHRIE